MRAQKLIVFIVLALIASVLHSAAPEPGVIIFKAKIVPDLYFSVSAFPTDSFNLLTEEDLQPKGPGVDIGTWTLRVDNPPAEGPTYTIQYSFEPLSILGSEEEGNEIEFEVLERESGSEKSTADTKNDNDTTVITVDSGILNTYTKTIAARLTSTGVVSALIAAASPYYQSNITVTLLAE